MINVCRKLFMPRTITLYLIKHFLTRLTILTSGIISLVFLITFIELIRKVDDRESIDTIKMLYLTLSQLGPVIDKILPFLILLSTLWSVFNLLKTAELIILKTSSLSVWRLSSIYCVTAFFITTLYIFTIMPFLATMHQDYRAWENDRVQIYKDIHKKVKTPNNQTVFFKADSYDMHTNHIHNIYITYLDEVGLLEKTYYAKQGIYNPNEKNIAFDTLSLLEANKVIMQKALIINDFKFAIDFSNIKRTSNKKKIMSHIYEYPILIKNQRQQNLSIKNLQNLFYSLLTLPIICAIYSFIAITALPSLYRGLQGTKNMLLALLGGLIFYVLDSWIIVVASTNSLPLVLALFTVKISVILLCIVIIFNKEYGFSRKKSA
jgi:lipopolysaccharide export LptBFGC system permease protein LptF